jgi:hypothetical protein
MSSDADAEALEGANRPARGFAALPRHRRSVVLEASGPARPAWPARGFAALSRRRRCVVLEGLGARSTGVACARVRSLSTPRTGWLASVYWFSVNVTVGVDGYEG